MSVIGGCPDVGGSVHEDGATPRRADSYALTIVGYLKVAEIG